MFSSVYGIRRRRTLIFYRNNNGNGIHRIAGLLNQSHCDGISLLACNYRQLNDLTGSSSLPVYLVDFNPSTMVNIRAKFVCTTTTTTFFPIVKCGMQT